MSAKKTLERALRHPFDDREPTDSAHRAALGTFGELTNRSGIGDALEQLDDDLRIDIVDAVAEVIREAMPVVAPVAQPLQVDSIAVCVKLLAWNRSQKRPPIVMPTEYFVANKVLELAGLRGPANDGSRSRKPIFYVASRASNPDRPRMWAEMRDTHGYNINSSWVDAAAAGLEVEFDLLWEAIAAEIARCDCLVLYAEPDDLPLKGAFVEVGMALAGGKPIRIVAPGVVLDPLDFKPLGSWAKHPLVKFASSVHEAFSEFRL